LACHGALMGVRRTPLMASFSVRVDVDGFELESTLADLAEGVRCDGLVCLFVVIEFKLRVDELHA